MSSEAEKLVEKWDNDVLEYPFSEAGFAAKAGVRLCVDELRAAIAKDGERERKLVEAFAGLAEAHHPQSNKTLGIMTFWQCDSEPCRSVAKILAAYDPQAQPNGGAK